MENCCEVRGVCDNVYKPNNPEIIDSTARNLRMMKSAPCKKRKTNPTFVIEYRTCGLCAVRDVTDVV